MNQKRDYNSLRPKGKFSSFGVGLLSMILCLGTAMSYANSDTNSVDNVLESAVQSTVTGTVTDSDGAPLPGANVLVKGTTNGTQTDFDGNYTINATSDATLVFSYLGYASQEVAINGQSTVNVSMADDASQLEEVVVLGYASQTRGDLTGSVASVNLEEATKQPIVNAAEALEGRVTGVTVVNSGSPGSSPKINVRGFGSTNNTNPLYIIDGVQTNNPSVLNSINPNDIEQMNVLKDGAASIYGARGANGVVIITTKGGGYNMSEPNVSIDMYTGFSSATNVPELLNAEQLGDVLFQSFTNDGTPFSHPQYGSGSSPVVPSSLQGYTRVVSYDPIVRGPATATVTPGGTDWLDAILRDAPTQNASITMENGNETGKYAFSVAYLNRDGVQINTGFKQGTARLNSEFKIGKRLTVGEHIGISFSRQNNNNQINPALRSSPLIPLFDDEGRFAGTGAQGTGNSRSPLALLERGKNDFNKLFRVFGDVYVSYEIVDGLTAKSTFGGNIEAFNRRAFQALDPEHGEPLGTNTLAQQTVNNTSWVWTNILNYTKQFGKHNVNAIGGLEAVKESSLGNQVSRTGYLFETPDFYLLNNGSGTPNVDFAFAGENTLFSIFGSVNYNYDGKYFLTATLRNDQTSRFGPENRGDTFPAFSAGWLISNEDFFPQDGVISRLKLKGSWGQIGNQDAGNGVLYSNLSGLSEGLANYALDGSTIATGAILTQVGNPSILWETTETTNIGLELGLMNNKMNIGFEVFDIRTTDLIARNNTLISTTAIDAAAPFVNLGDVKNTGFDFSIGYADETESGFSYGLSANISHYKNEVTRSLNPFEVPNAGLRGGDVTRTQVGQPISAFFGREVTGIDSNGRFTYADTNNDGQINDDDRTFIGSPHPDFIYGINLNLGYKGFDLSALFTGSQGNEIYNYEKIFTDFPTFVNGNRSVRVLDSWTPSNTNAELPALSTSIQNAETQPNSYFIEDGSFFRLKNLQIGYSLPDNTIEKIGLDGFRIYVQGSNLFTITDYEGFDPEIVSNNNLNLGVDNNVYPIARILTLGVNLKL
jgi:TonB-linked SusC/RagA family outer membrane protein